MSNNFENEQAFRRGYAQGANAAVEAFANGHASDADVQTMRAWVQAIYDWRHADKSDFKIAPKAPLAK